METKDDDCRVTRRDIEKDAWKGERKLAAAACKAVSEDQEPAGLCLYQDDAKSERGLPSKREWSTTKESDVGSARLGQVNLDESKEPIAVVMRAVTFVYRRIIAKPTEGGLRDFFETNAHMFAVEGDEHQLAWTDLFKEYERLVDGAMTDFAASEGMEVADLFQMIKERLDDARLSKFTDMLVAAGSYAKFVQLMKAKAKAMGAAAAAR